MFTSFGALYAGYIDLEHVGYAGTPANDRSRCGTGSSGSQRSRLSDSPIPVTPTPVLGQYNAGVFREWMGVGPEELAKLKAEGMIGFRPGSGARRTRWTRAVTGGRKLERCDSPTKLP